MNKQETRSHFADCALKEISELKVKKSEKIKITRIMEFVKAIKSLDGGKIERRTN